MPSRMNLCLAASSGGDGGKRIRWGLGAARSAEREDSAPANALAGKGGRNPPSRHQEHV